MFKLRQGIISILVFFLVGVMVCVLTFSNTSYDSVDVIALNRLSKEVANHWGDLESFDYTSYPFDFAVLDLSDEVLLETDASLQLSYSKALKEQDTIIDVKDSDEVIVGKIIVAMLYLIYLHNT